MLKRVLMAVTFAILPGLALAQRDIGAMPKEVFTAKTVAIVNNTHNDQVEQGAIEALKRRGKLTVIDDSDVADVTLTFDKRSEHEGTSKTTTGDDGKPNTSYGMTFGSSTYMKAVLKGSVLPFFKTSTGDSKKKAGIGCVTDLESAYNSGR
ncbi:hypothetical protein [Granulicella arctica]|uniref:hypothetical protein n=1 Tax=Granulicella arctica TaxID=940613 RepID=UPI0021E0D935|nr:hypothetical protein [Granulicella arctica]